MSDLYLVWSIEHTMWWRPHQCGYTPHVKAAGHYPKGAALTICEKANEFSDKLKEEMIHISLHQDEMTDTLCDECYFSGADRPPSGLCKSPTQAKQCQFFHPK
jgi:hypothetical protein